MFSESEYLARVNGLTEQQLARGSIREYFLIVNHPHEVTAMLLRGGTRFFEDILHFWVSAVHEMRWCVYRAEDRMTPRGECKPLDRRGWEKLASPCLTGDHYSLVIQGRGAFVRGLQMADEWNEIGAVAEFAEEYVALVWDTGA